MTVFLATVFCLVGQQQAAADGANSAPPSQDTEAQETDEALQEVLAAMQTRLASEANTEGLRAFKAGDNAAALEAFGRACDLAPNEPEYVNNLAYLYHQLGNVERATELYERTLALAPERLVAYLNYADLLLERANAAPDRVRVLERAGELLSRAVELKGADALVTLRRARLADQRGHWQRAELLYREAYAARADAALAIEVGDFYRDHQQTVEARQWYQRALDADDPRAQERVHELDVEEQARRLGWSLPNARRRGQAQRIATEAQQRIARGELEAAKPLIDRALSLDPLEVRARLAEGDWLRASSQLAKAELAYLRALALAPSDAAAQERLAQLYLAEPQPRAAEAALLFERAMQLRPDWTQLNWPLAQAKRAAGDLAGALLALEAFAQYQPDAPEQAEASVLRQTLQEALGKTKPPAKVATSAPSEALGKVQALLSRGELDAALAAVDAIPDHEGSTAALNLAGDILFAAGKRGEAAAQYRRSLELDADQPEVHLQLGLALASAGNLPLARRELDTALAQGEADAAYHLARLQAPQASSTGDMLALAGLWRARALLVRYIDEHKSAALSRQAVHLLEQTEQRLLGAFGLWLLLGLAAGVAIWLAWWQRYGGAALQALLTAHPGAGARVQEVLASIRHEVLKHNTMRLDAAAAAIEAGEDPTLALRPLTETLFATGPRSAIVRLWTYAHELERIGRAHGVRLNLRQRDPVLRPIFAGLKQLQKHGRRILAGGNKGQKLLAQARAHLNVQGYGGLQSLLRDLGAVDLNAEVLRGAFLQVRAEPALAELPFAPLDLEAAVTLPVRLAVAKDALDEMLHNLLRNAAQASVRENLVPVALGLHVSRRVHPVTGHVRIAIAVRDQASSGLTVESVRQAPAGRGLGLVNALVNRSQGATEIAEGVGKWRKAVILLLPTADG